MATSNFFPHGTKTYQNANITVTRLERISTIHSLRCRHPGLLPENQSNIGSTATASVGAERFCFFLNVAEQLFAEGGASSRVELTGLLTCYLLDCFVMIHGEW